MSSPPRPALIRPFDVHGLFAAVDEQRRARYLSWTATATEMAVATMPGVVLRISPSTLTRAERADDMEADGALMMIRWVRRTFDSFLARPPDGAAPMYRDGLMYRFDVATIHAELDRERIARSLTWRALAEQLSQTDAPIRFTTSTLIRLANGGRVTVQQVAVISGWLERSADHFTRAAVV